MLDAERKQKIQDLMATFGVEINNFDLFDQALTHASAAADLGAPEYNYESLEFLGDAVLGLAAAQHLFDDFPDRTPGEYSKMRAGLVSKRCLSRVARNLEIGPIVRLGRGEEMAGGRQRTALLADCLEALIGAVYLDSGWDTARQVVGTIFQDEFSRADVSIRAWDYKSRLQDYCQARRIALPDFRVIKESGPDHQKEFEVEVLVEGQVRGTGRGRSKKEAEQLAAREALGQNEHNNG
jgi:ribonuclease-3